MRAARMALLLAVAVVAAASDIASDSAASGPDADRLKWPLIFAAGEGDAATLRSLLAAGADVRERSRDGETALHVSAIRGGLEAVRALLDAGAEVDARTPVGSTIYMTPSMWATYLAMWKTVAQRLRPSRPPARPASCSTGSGRPYRHCFTSQVPPSRRYGGDVAGGGRGPHGDGRERQGAAHDGAGTH